MPCLGPVQRSNTPISRPWFKGPSPNSRRWASRPYNRPTSRQHSAPCKQHLPDALLRIAPNEHGYGHGEQALTHPGKGSRTLSTVTNLPSSALLQETRDGQNMVWSLVVVPRPDNNTTPAAHFPLRPPRSTHATPARYHVREYLACRTIHPLPPSIHLKHTQPATTTPHLAPVAKSAGVAHLFPFSSTGRRAPSGGIDVTDSGWLDHISRRGSLR